MARLLYWIRKCLRGKSRLCKSFCVTCPYFEQCKGDSEIPFYPLKKGGFRFFTILDV